MADDTLAVNQPQPIVVTEADKLATAYPEMATKIRQAQILLKAGLLPSHFNTVAKVLSVGMAADEMGIGTQQAARSMYVIDGKVGLSTNLLLGLAFKKVAGFWIKLVESTTEKCTVTLGRSGGSEATVSFTMADAMKAGLNAFPKSGRPGAWQKYPQDMLLNRAISKGLRIIAPDATMGMHSDEEVRSLEAPADTTPLSAESITVDAVTVTKVEDQNGQG